MNALLERQRARYFRVVTSKLGGGLSLDMALQVERFTREMAADGVGTEDAMGICETEAELIRTRAPLFNIQHNLGRQMTLQDLAAVALGSGA